jgi:hypothetical protein
LNQAALSITAIPGLVKTYALAEALVGMVQEPAAYASLMITTWRGSRGNMEGSNKEPAPGPGIPDLRNRVEIRYARKMRSRAI